MASTIVGLYNSFADAQKVVSELQDAGFRRDDISLVAKDDKGEYARYFDEGAKGKSSARGAEKGAGVGAVLGGVAGLLAGIGVLAIPVIGPALVAGPIVGLLAGAGIGAAAGGIVGALVKAGVPEDEARLYQEGVNRGGTLVTLQTDDDMADQAVDIMNRHNPIDVNEKASEWGTRQTMTGQDQTSSARRQDTLDTSRASDMTANRPITDADTDNTDTVKKPVVQEELQVGKRQVQKGGVRVHTRVTEQPVDETVNLRKEHVDVRRNPVDRPASPGEVNAFEEDDIEMVETDEEPVVQKQARVVEEVVVSKDVENEQQAIHDTVRRQDVDVEQTGQGMAGRAGTYDDRAFRSHYQRYYANSGRRYDQFLPAYRYGYDLRNNDQYSGRDWGQVEPRIRSDWERTHPDMAWDDVRDAIHQGWDSFNNPDTSTSRDAKTNY